MINIGDTNIKHIKIGDTAVKKVVFRESILYENIETVNTISDESDDNE